MILKSWKFKGFEAKQDMPKWVQENSSKRKGSSNLFAHTQVGETPVQTGEHIAISLRGHITIHTDKPDNLIFVTKEIIAGIAFLIAVAVVIVVMLAM
jgi:hypothetical protein|tara:strand:+ start:221 stop:511 length:291 start_codon:yes stop_codon:yes gene_type:complete